MSTVKTNNVQVGQSGTATNNFTLYQPSTPDGTVRLAVGNSGATTSDVLVANSSGNVGIGTTTPLSRIHAYGAANAQITLQTSANSAYVGNINGALELQSADIIKLLTSGANERVRVDINGNVLVGTTNATGDGGGVEIQPNQANGGYIAIKKTSSLASGNRFMIFTNNGSVIGSITANGTTNVAYNTSSDYRLKDNVEPMTGALAKVQMLKPCTWTWKGDGTDGQGFIAHELQEVVPDCVTGEKDAVDERGRPSYQGVDTSFLVATLTAAIQELKAELDSVKAELATLKGAQ